MLITDDTPDVFLREITSDSHKRLDLPEDWPVSGAPVRISSTGFCSGGFVTIEDDKGRRISYRLNAPKCVPLRERNRPS